METNRLHLREEKQKPDLLILQDTLFEGIWRRNESYSIFEIGAYNIP